MWGLGRLCPSHHTPQLSLQPGTKVVLSSSQWGRDAIHICTQTVKGVERDPGVIGAHFHPTQLFPPQEYPCTLSTATHSAFARAGLVTGKSLPFSPD